VPYTNQSQKETITLQKVSLHIPAEALKTHAQEHTVLVKLTADFRSSSRCSHFCLRRLPCLQCGFADRSSWLSINHLTATLLSRQGEARVWCSPSSLWIRV